MELFVGVNQEPKVFHAPQGFFGCPWIGREFRQEFAQKTGCESGNIEQTAVTQVYRKRTLVGPLIRAQSLQLSLLSLPFQCL